MIVLDYMQDLARGAKEEQVRNRVGDIATDLRAISQLLDCCMVAVCSVSRTYYGEKKQQQLRESPDPRVYLAAAKESGDVDYAAAVVVFIDLGIAPEKGMPRPGRLAVAKARHGDPAYCGARFHGASGRWVADASALQDLAAEKQQQGAGVLRVEELVGPIVATITRAGRPLSKNDLEKELKGNAERLRAAIDYAADERLIVAVDIDPRTGRSWKGGGIRWGLPVVAAAALPEVPRDPSLVGFLGNISRDDASSTT